MQIYSELCCCLICFTPYVASTHGGQLPKGREWGGESGNERGGRNEKGEGWRRGGNKGGEDLRREENNGDIRRQGERGDRKEKRRG